MAGRGQPVVTVVMLTYAHGRFVRQAVESVLSQDLASLQVVIGDDASPDDTADVLRQVTAGDPRVELVLRPTNIGAQENFADTWARARGEFIAVLEGDDYWTSSTKLTRQVQLMRDRADTTLAFHRVRSVDEDGTLGDEHWPRSQAKEFRLADLIRANEIQTCSVLYRAGIVPTLPAWFTSLVMNDWPLHLLHAYQGSIGYIDDEMAYYRMHSGGLWSGRTLAARYLESARTLANVAYRSAPDARTKRALVRSARRFGLSALRNAALDHDPVLVTRALRTVARPAL